MPRRLAAILAADIAGYSRLMEADEAGTLAARKEIPAEAYYMLGKYRKAIEVLESMLVLPTFYVHEQIAMAYAQLGDTEAAERHIALYQTQLPDNTMITSCSRATSASARGRRTASIRARAIASSG